MILIVSKVVIGNIFRLSSIWRTYYPVSCKFYSFKCIWPSRGQIHLKIYSCVVFYKPPMLGKNDIDNVLREHINEEKRRFLWCLPLIRIILFKLYGSKLLKRIWIMNISLSATFIKYIFSSTKRTHDITNLMCISFSSWLQF